MFAEVRIKDLAGSELLMGSASLRSPLPVLRMPQQVNYSKWV